MSRPLSVSIENEGTFWARPGDLLLDAALMNGIEVPHDCRSGHCGTCRCKVVSGVVVGGETDAHGSILACQTRIWSDLEIGVEDIPTVETFAGRVTSIGHLAKDVVEVTISTPSPVPYLPGQYCQFRFNGFPVRAYSPTIALEGPANRDTIRLHIRRIPNGRVSGAFGRSIRPGHKVKIIGPYGSAYFRPGNSNRLVLVGSGTGFAPIWSIAHAALCEMPDRELVVIAAAKKRDSLYMGRALVRLAAFPKVRVVPVLEHLSGPTRVFRLGRPTDFLPKLTNEDCVYAAGAPAMVTAVADSARTAGAPCYVDPFAATQDEETLMVRARKLLDRYSFVGKKVTSFSMRTCP
jgi:NAD(P)H-flavin reductase/ferredoxin